MIILELQHMIDNIPDNDEPPSVQRCVSYLQGLLRIKQVVPPVVEIMTIIKQQKPVLFHGTRRTIMPTSNLHMLFQIDMEPALAATRLKEFLKT